MVQKVPLLYLANDILQNSKRKGNEFVSQFRKVLPAALTDLLEKGDDHGKSTVSRLVDIWEQRKVFGSCPQSLKDIMLGKEVPAPFKFNKKRSRSVGIVRRDSRSIRTKLSIGSAAEKISSAFHLVLSEDANEEAEMSKCKTAVHCVRKMEKKLTSHVLIVRKLITEKDPKRKTLSKELEEEENSLKECIEKLKLVEASRGSLVSQLKEALHEQDPELENVRTQMQVAQVQAEGANFMQKRLNDEDFVSKPSTASNDAVIGRRSPTKSAAAIAAKVADKLTPSSSSQMIMTSVLSTFAAQEAKNHGLTSSSTSATNSISKSKNSVVISDPSVYMAVQPLSAHPNHSFQSVVVAQPAIVSHVQSSQPQFHIFPNTVPVPSQQYLNNPYGYAGISPLPRVAQRPPLPQMTSRVPLMQITQQPPSMTIPVAHQPPAPPSFRPLAPPGMVYYGQIHPSQ